ncbi:MAG TPA: FtsK/SpoIIIE domain-containing protein [Pirellulaceae bacterium]
MSDPFVPFERQRELIDRILRLAARRSSEGGAANERDRQRSSVHRREFERLRDAAIAEFKTGHAAKIAEYKAARETVLAAYDSEGHKLLQQEKQLTVKSEQEMVDSIADAKTLRQHRAQQVLKAYREQKTGPRKELAIFQQKCQASAAELHSLVLKMQELIRRRGTDAAESVATPPAVPGLTDQEYVKNYQTALGRAIERLAKIQNQPAARFVEEGWPALIFIFAVPVAFGLSWLLLKAFGWGVVLGVTGVGSLAAAIGSWAFARPYAKRQTRLVLPEFMAAISEAHTNLSAARDAGKAAANDAKRKVIANRDADLAEAKAEYKRRRKEAKFAHAKSVKQAEGELVTRRARVESKYEEKLHALDRQYLPEIEQIEASFTNRLAALRQQFLAQFDASRQQRDHELAELTAAWNAAVAELSHLASATNDHCSRHAPGWDTISSPNWQPPRSGAKASASSGNGEPAESLSALAIGHFDIDLASADAPADKTTHFTLPAALEFPTRPSLLLEAEGAGRDAATDVLQDAMLRLLTALPPGKVRFTIIDPVGLGQNFSAFMHLADYDDKLVGSRIWTESAHINQRLADLTQHMENVIQKYLRNEFSSIQEYNEQAGEVAEPFQILVVANFPANFSEDAARRLAAIATSGARCGVSMLVSTDSKLSLPRNFDLNDLAGQAVTLVWDDESNYFRSKDAVMGQLPLALEQPPDDANFTQIVKKIGSLAKDASRVEVPFEMIMPPRNEWWQRDSRGEIEVALGRAGAKSLQTMRLGKGTSQHVLISGKTGSGKSTLLNALITNLALCYSPNEIEFYLIDFKKGVEFKAYAVLGLPHARVIAIESEREFGMSVLERLDQELKRRGDLFRRAGVQDLKSYRNAMERQDALGGRGSRRAEDEPATPAQQELRPPDERMPRVLLIIDEFQEFFTTDDRVAHDAALLLDRLVRQGRAFGIHVLLGSQTLAGAYSLARSTLGQMAVRIALQCSETDAHLILSEDNSAARLLSRPGEAIYNDANGLVEGNHPFQVVWLSDSEREERLTQVSELARQRHAEPPKPIVFEGNAAADPAENKLLGSMLQSASDATRSKDGLQAWLGAAVAIKDPTAAMFRPQSGSNLLVVGQSDEQAIGMLSVGVISLASQLGPLAGAASAIPRSDSSPTRLQRFYILDGARPESAEAGLWQRLLDKTGIDGAVLQPRGAGQLVSDLADEVNRRLAAGEQSAEPIFLVIYNLARFRDLKKADDYSFDDDSSAAAGKKFATILREGPSVGIHSLIWCDSYNNANRWLDRQSMRDFEMRVLFQMSAADSSNLMDSPAASKLSNYTAIFYSDERGVAEKFRPYGPPQTEWLQAIAHQLAACLQPPQVTSPIAGSKPAPGP